MSEGIFFREREDEKRPRKPVLRRSGGRHFVDELDEESDDSQFVDSAIEASGDFPEIVNQSKVKGVRSLSDLRNLPGLDAVIKPGLDVEEKSSAEYRVELTVEAEKIVAEIETILAGVDKEREELLSDALEGLKSIKDRLSALASEVASPEVTQELESLVMTLGDYRERLVSFLEEIGEPEVVQDDLQAAETDPLVPAETEVLDSDSLQLSLGRVEGNDVSEEAGPALTGAEVLESDILQSGSAPKYAVMGRRLGSYEPAPASRPERTIELFRRWQSGDPTLFDVNWWHHFDAIAQDVSVMMKAAGYDEAAVHTIGEELLRPWMDKVNAKRQGKAKEVRFNDLQDELLGSVRELLKGMAPNPAVLEGGSESPVEQENVAVEGSTESVVEDGSEEEDVEALVSPSTLPEVERILERTQFNFTHLREALANEPAAAADIAQGERLMEQLANLQETDDTVKLTRKQKYLKTLLVLNERLHTYLPEEEPASYLDLVAADPGNGGGGGPARVSSESAPVNPERELSYAEARSERKVARAAFTEARDEYYTALHDYYRNLGVRARELVGMTVTLPPELEALKAKYDEKQRVYAEALDEALAARAQVAGNREYNSLAAESTKAAFAERFVFRSVEEIEAAKREVGSPSEFVSRAKALATFVREHKTLVRIGALGMHMAVGAVSGGVANAAFVGARVLSGMAAGAAGGLAGANVGRRVFAEDVAAAQAKTTETKEKTTNEFSFANLNRAAEDYQAAYRTQKRTETKHRVATITGAVMGGMAAGRAASEVVSDIYEGFTSTPIITTSAEVARYTPNGEALPTLKIEGITLRGSNVGSLTESELPDAQMPQIFKEIRLHLADLLEAHPNMSQGKLEDEVFARLEAKYGSEEWWQKADIKSFDIGSISEKITSIAAPASPEEPTLAEPVPPEPIAAKPATTEVPMQIERTVTQGDTLTKIMKEEYADLLKDLSPTERDRVLAELFEKARVDATLRESIGLKSGDVDRIYVGEQLELSKLGDELKSIIESEPTRPRTGALPVAMEGDVEDVPIRFGGSPITETTIDMDGVTESTPADFDTSEVVRLSESAVAASGPLVYNPPRPELGYVISGNYFESPQYRDFLAEQGVSVERVADATSKFALEFEGKTYSWLNEVLQKFDSPYTELKTMSLKELDTIREQAGGSEERLRVLLAEQAAKEAAKQGMVVGDVPKTFNLPTMRAWESLIDSIRRTEGFAYNENTTIEDLVKRHVAEQMIKQDYDVRFKASMKQ